MSYVDAIFERLNLQHIREFLLHGVECVEISQSDYKQRIEEAWKPMDEVIKTNFPDTEGYEKVTDKVQGYASATQDVYMEIGIKCGAALAAQLLTRSAR